MEKQSEILMVCYLGLHLASEKVIKLANQLKNVLEKCDMLKYEKIYMISYLLGETEFIWTCYLGGKLKNLSGQNFTFFFFFFLSI